MAEEDHSERGSGARRLGRIPDAEFVALLRARDAAAWDELRDFLRRLAASKAWGVVDESCGPDDYVQLACLRLWKVLGRPETSVGSTSLKAYLAVTMQNLIREANRRRGGVTHVPRGPTDGQRQAPRYRVDLEEAQRAFDDRGLPADEHLSAEYERRAAQAFAVLEELSGGSRGRQVRKIAALLLDRIRSKDASSLLLTLDTNLFQLLYPESSGWSERKRTKHRVRLNRFREAFVAALVDRRRRQRGETP